MTPTSITTFRGGVEQRESSAVDTAFAALALGSSGMCVRDQFHDIQIGIGVGYPEDRCGDPACGQKVTMPAVYVDCLVALLQSLAHS
jgi:hypothetical protein